MCCEPYSITNEGGCITIRNEDGKIIFQGIISCINPSADCESVLISFQGSKTPRRYNKECLIGGDDLSEEEFISLFDVCPPVDEDPEYEAVSGWVFERCKDGVKHQIQGCKDENREFTYVVDDGTIFTDFLAIKAAGYLVECIEKQYDCSEVILTVPEGETYTYEDLLDYFNDNSTFDDGSAGAEGINYIQFANLNKDGLTYQYNGTNGILKGSLNFGDNQLLLCICVINFPLLLQSPISVILHDSK